MTQSLRGRLLIGVISLVVIGLLILDVAIYTSLQRFLTSRVDDQLLGAHNTAISALGGPNQGPGPQSGGGLPEDTLVELVSPNGTLLLAKRLQFAPSTSKALPVLPHTLPSAAETHPALTTLAGTGGVSQYRAAIWQEDLFQGNTVVLAIPLSEVASTLSQLLQLELLISLGVVAAMAILAFLIIRISLRPLEKMGSVARESPNARLPTAACAVSSPTPRTSCAPRSPPSAAIPRCSAGAPGNRRLTLSWRAAGSKRNRFA